MNTVLFAGRDATPDEAKEAAETMKKIADENDGTFNQVSVDNLKETGK